MNSKFEDNSQAYNLSGWKKQHAETIWTSYVLIFMGFWLLVNLPTFGNTGIQLAWSDSLSGLLLIFFGFFSLSAKNVRAPWFACLIGIWLQLAPLIFWAPTPFNYLNDTLTGALVIGLSILIPGTPGHVEDSGPDVPKGWSYNPSSWAQRIPIIVLTCICWFTSRYMAAFQLGYIDHIWDPIFGNGTLNVITSSLSKEFPVSDAGLGAAVYSIEALMGAKGGVRRWRTMPWIVTLFGILVVPAGLVSIVLIMLQPLLIGSWCFWCLLTAACMLMMIALTIDEVVAVVQYLRECTKAGQSFRHVFWKGGLPLPHSNFETHPPQFERLHSFFSSSLKGIGIPWNLALSALLGLWLLFHSGPYRLANDLAHIFGALTITISIISMAEVMRSARFFNILLGILSISIPFLTESPNAVTWKAMVVGLLLILLSLPRGRIKEKYGNVQGSIF
jgi:hypothetical protein